MIEIKRAGEKYSDVDLKVASVFYKEKALLRPDFAVHRIN